MAVVISSSCDGHGSVHEEGQANDGLVPRPYQLEMLEESMRRNLIIAMDTGSGKTLIAILRIQAELERCPAEKLVWFCVPTVALAEQQYRAISAQLPSYQIRVLSGKDNCEFWTRKTWLEVLKGTRIVVSTHSILFDALVHAFVKIYQLSLLIFDEAHRATKDHPANKIMQDFYHPAAIQSQPSILGLTASPVINNKVDSLETLESNLDAIARTPKLHRSDLIKFVHKPELIQLRYRSSDSSDASLSPILRKLGDEYERYDLSRDPWIMKMKFDTDPYHEQLFMKAVMKKKTWCREQLRSLYEKAKRLTGELGLWASKIFIHQCLEKFRISETQTFTIEETVEDREKSHLRSILDQVDTYAATEAELVLERMHVTPKVQELINFLSEQDTEAFAGLVFVETRAEVAVLSQLLELHPLTRSFAISTFVGESNSSNRKFSLGELADIRNQKSTLDDLRHGIKNLVVTTNALEEGIDVSACNLVICFNKPPNLKSFVQRRGRARKDISKYVIMLEERESVTIVSKWRELEELMREIYENDMRELQRLEKLEDEEPGSKKELYVEATGAKLDCAGAVSHLYHFCNTLPHDPYVEQAPMFFYTNHSFGGPDRELSARVVLPSSVDLSIREAHSKETWATEKNAKRDAAFEAYAALYHAGLINDNLLPQEAIDTKDEAIEKRPNLAEVDPQINIWSHVAEQWHHATELRQNIISLECARHQWARLSMLLPVSLPEIPILPLYWDSSHTLEVTVGQSSCFSSAASIGIQREVTSVILHSVFGSRMSNCQDDFLALFVPPLLCEKKDELEIWLNTHKGFLKASDIAAEPRSYEDPTSDLNQLVSRSEGLIRDLSHNRASYVFLGAKRAISEDTANGSVHNIGEGSDAPQLLLTAKKFPKRTDFLHQVVHNTTQEQGLGIQTLLADTCEVDNLPWRVAMFASLVPSILHIIHKTMLVNELCSGLLAPLNIQDKNLVTTAISASSAREPQNYQRLEFLGDSVLKLLTSMGLMARYPIYDEGRLSRAKDRIVSNKSLSVAAIEAGLAPYILTKAFTGKKWRPLYVSDVLAAEKMKEKREMSTKTLADVVESLIGAAFLDGGSQNVKALDCLKIFLPSFDWTYTSKAHTILHEIYISRNSNSPNLLLQAEELIGRQFGCKSLLLEAITHASHRGFTKCGSYQRLEFLGDSILDNIVTAKAFRRDPPVPVHRLHLIREALVNGHFLGYLCMRLSTAMSRTEIRNTGPKSVETFDTEAFFVLWQAMRHSNRSIALQQVACLARYEEVKDGIASALSEGDRYPWTLLARLEPPKPFSDIIESIIAAIWIDSSGSLAACSDFLERLNMFSYLKRVLESDDLSLLHPKEELGQLADQEKVEYTVTVEEDDETSKKQLSCKIKVGDRQIVNAGAGLSKMEIETRAADEACKILRKEGRRLGKKERRNSLGEIRDDVVVVGGQGREGEEGEEEQDGDEDEGGVKINDSGSLKRKIDEHLEKEDESDENEEEYMSAEE